jgi:tetratricopeptide (TPR) repeat protein
MLKSPQTKSYSEEGTEIDCFLCPISLEIMSDPVITPYGHTYERQSIEKWLEENDSDPFTRQPLSKAQLIPNIALRQAIDVWKRLDQEWKQNSEKCKEKIERQKVKLSEIKAKEKQQEMEISKLKEKGKEQEEKIIEEKERSIVYKEQYIVASQRFSSIGRKKAEGFKLSDSGFIGYLLEYFPGEAKKICELLDRENPNEKDKDLEAAIAILERLREQHAKDNNTVSFIIAKCGYIKECLGKLRHNAEDYEKAFDDYALAGSLTKDAQLLSKICTQQGWCLYRIQMLAEGISKEERIEMLERAASLYDKAIEYDRENSKAIFLKGKVFKVLYDKTRDAIFNQLAIEVFTSLLKSEKADGAYVELGQIYSMQGDYEEAVKMHAKAVQLNPIVFNYNELAGCYKSYATKTRHEQRMFFSLLEKAVAHYKESLKLYNEDEKVHCDLGFCLEKLGPASWNEAMRYYTNALTINPYHSLALKNRERLEDKMSQNQRGYAGNQNQRGRGRSQGTFFESPNQRYQGSSSSSSSPNSKRW